MTRKQISAGQLWRIHGSSDIALVVCVFDDELFGEDLRVLPVFKGPQYVAIATDRDVIVPERDNTLGHLLLVNCWNGQSIGSADLGEKLGLVSDEALAAARATELVGISPDAEHRFVEWRGDSVHSDSDFRLHERAVLYKHWERLRDRLTLFRDAQTMVMTRASYGPGYLFRGKLRVAESIPEYQIAVSKSELCEAAVAHNCDRMVA